MAKPKLVCVGACAIDTILGVPHYPEEDSKLRATAFSRRRGGNSPNTLEVLQQLIEEDCTNTTGNENDDESGDGTPIKDVPEPELYLVAMLPARTSADTNLIASSFHLPSSAKTSGKSDGRTGSSTTPYRTRVNLSRCFFREQSAQAISSYIISSQSTSSRTIINHNAIPEMSLYEFIQSTHDLITPNTKAGSASENRVWFHFEGRIPETTLKCMRYLRDDGSITRVKVKSPPDPVPDIKISVELEKPGREGLQELAHEADVVFYSRAWAKGEGYSSAEQCLQEQSRLLTSGTNGAASRKMLICPWGELGASALSVMTLKSSPGHGDNVGVVHSAAYALGKRPIVDSTGAGDTFIAGVLFGLICRDSSHSPWSLRQTLDFANGLAGRKILQQGFGGLGKGVSSLKDKLDGETRDTRRSTD